MLHWPAIVGRALALGGLAAMIALVPLGCGDSGAAKPGASVTKPPEIEQSNKSEPSKTAVALKLTPEGSRILGQWSERNIGSRLGLFLDGTLTDAPEIKSRIDGIIPVGTEFSPQEAAVISARLRRGGAK